MTTFYFGQIFYFCNEVHESEMCRRQNVIIHNTKWGTSLFLNLKYNILITESII